MKYIMLDIDGVCNNNFTRTCTSDGWCFVDDELVMRIKKIIDVTGAQIVLTSTWRDGWTSEPSMWDVSFRELRAKFNEFGMDFAYRTGDWEKCRGFEIQTWLNHHNDVESFVIIDDWPDMAHLINRLVCTNPLTGITDEDANEAIKILNIPYVASESIRFRDLLRVYGDCAIMVRTNYPKNLRHDMSNDEYEQGMLYGYCEWHDGELISDDGDNYYLDWVISKYEVAPLSGDLTIWLDVEWSGDNEIN